MRFKRNLNIYLLVLIVILLSSCSRAVFEQEEFFENSQVLEYDSLGVFIDLYDIFSSENHVAILQYHDNTLKASLYNEANLLANEIDLALNFELSKNDDYFVFIDSGFYLSHQTNGSTKLFYVDWENGSLELIYEIEYVNCFEKYQLDLLVYSEEKLKVVFKSSNSRDNAGNISFEHILLTFDIDRNLLDYHSINSNTHEGYHNTHYYYLNEKFYGVPIDLWSNDIIIVDDTGIKTIGNIVECSGCFLSEVTVTDTELNIFYLNQIDILGIFNLYMLRLQDDELLENVLILEEYKTYKYTDFTILNDLLVNTRIQGLSVEDVYGETYISIITIDTINKTTNYFVSEIVNTLAKQVYIMNRVYTYNIINNEVIYIELE